MVFLIRILYGDNMKILQVLGLEKKVEEPVHEVSIGLTEDDYERLDLAVKYEKKEIL